MAVKLGPILQFRGNTNMYCISALIVLDMQDVAPAASLSPSHAEPMVTRIASIPFESPSYIAWRIDFRIQQTELAMRYEYAIAGIRGAFTVPGRHEKPRLAYGSCNGFSEAKLMKQAPDQHERWRHMSRLHQLNAYHLLLLGGDQIYSDAMWKEVPLLAAWLNLPAPQRYQRVFTREMSRRLDSYFCHMYLQRWSAPAISQVFANIPSIMMWDDHDIMDGWGSYPQEQHYSAVYQGVFNVARNYFRLFQQQCAADEQHPAAIAGAQGFHMAFDGLGGLTLLVPDLRSERQPAGATTQPAQIISAKSWQAIYHWMDSCQPTSNGHLLLMSSIPIAYLDLGTIEKMLGLLPGQQELEDDLRDHWSSEPHRQERKRLIHRLFEHAQRTRCRITILSGDVHVGALSVLESTRQADTSRGQCTINQLISTGIVHPAPPALVRYVLEQVADKVEPVDHGITATMQPIAGHGRYLIGARNWLAIEPDAQHRLWCNWHVEGMTAPLTKVVHPSA